MAFMPKVNIFRGSITIPASPARVFPLFSPAGECLWVPQWNPELIFPQGGEWAENQVFRTIEDSGDAIWVVSKLEVDECHVVYFRFEPSKYVANVEVRVKHASVEDSEVSVVYTYIGLTEQGNEEIQGMSSVSYEAKMQRWSMWLTQYLTRQE